MASHIKEDRTTAKTPFPVIIVTGGTSGIGEAIVRLFAERGWHVVFCSDQEKEGLKLQELLTKDFPQVYRFLLYDAAKEEDIKKVVDYAVETFGHVNCLVNNIGVHPPPKYVDDFTSHEFRSLFDVNVMSHFLATKFAIPHLRETKGSIVNVASLTASVGQAKASIYCATKAAIVGMTKAIAIDEAPRGVRVNCISPSNIWTPGWDSWAAKVESNPQASIRMGKLSQAMGRFGTAEECAKTCFFLTTEATFMTGVDVLLTGGSELGYGLKADESQITNWKETKSTITSKFN